MWGAGNKKGGKAPRFVWLDWAGYLGPIIITI